MSNDVASAEAKAAQTRASVVGWLTRFYVRVGALPILLIVGLVVFTLMADNFLTLDNLHSALRQNSYIVIATIAQLVVLLTGGFDLSVGAITALVSVTTAMSMAVTARTAGPEAAIAAGVVTGLLVGLACGLINAVGVALLRINPFITTLATASIFGGLALILTSGVPVRGMPPEFSKTFGFGTWFGIGTSIWIAAAVAVVMWLLLAYTTPGRHVYAVGSSARAARLSGVSEARVLTLVYATAGVLAGIGAVLLTARLETGEANIGSSLPLQTIAAAVIGGVSLRGGTGRVLDAVLGAIFLGLVVNGMNLAHVNSYYQMLVTGAVLAFAVVADRLRSRASSLVYSGRI